MGNLSNPKTGFLLQDSTRGERLIAIDPMVEDREVQPVVWMSRQREFAVAKGWDALFVLIGLGAFLRLPLAFLGLWRDEAATVLNIQGETIAAFFNNILVYENSPPGFFLLMGLWIRCFGTNDWVVKIPAVAIGLLLIPAVYLLGKTVSSNQVGRMAAALVALAAPTVFYSQEIRPYGLVALLVTLAMVFYTRLLRSGGMGRRDWIALVLSLTGAMYVQYTGLLFGVSLGLMTIGAWLYGRRRALPIGKFAIAGGAVFCLYLPWLMVFLGQMQGGLSYGSGQPWNHALAVSERPLRAVFNVFYAMTPGFPNQLGGSLCLVLAVLAFGNFKAKGKGLEPLPATTPPGWNIGLMVLAGTVVLTAAIEGALSMGGRYMFLMTPLGWVLLSHGLLWLTAKLRAVRGPWVLKSGLVALLGCLLLILSLGPTLGYPGRDKSGARPLIADLDQGLYPAVESTIYLALPDVLGITANYYQGQATRSSVRQATFHGFPHWDHPELHVPNDYYKAWMNPNAVAETLRSIEQQRGDRYLGLMYSPSISRLLQPQYRDKVEAVLANLKRRYPIVAQKQYGSKHVERYDLTEEFTFYLFDLGDR
jgi:4-amino-4-deoxy-L-arabinose transferase-like glycosyltransferase